MNLFEHTRDRVLANMNYLRWFSASARFSTREWASLRLTQDSKPGAKVPIQSLGAHFWYNITLRACVRHYYESLSCDVVLSRIIFTSRGNCSRKVQSCVQNWTWLPPIMYDV